MLLNNKSPEVENIGPKILIEISAESSGPLAYIFNHSFAAGVVSDSLTTSYPNIYKEIKVNMEITKCRRLYYVGQVGCGLWPANFPCPALDL